MKTRPVWNFSDSVNVEVGFRPLSHSLVSKQLYIGSIAGSKKKGGDCRGVAHAGPWEKVIFTLKGGIV